MKRRILVIEDDETLRRTLAFNLAREGYEALTAPDGAAGLEAARRQRPDLVLLDVMLPGMSGLELLRVLRREGREVPVIVLSAKGSEIDRVVGLNLGADDYVAKPFSRPELLARIEAVLRRGRPDVGTSTSEEAEARVEIGRIAIDPNRREVLVEGEPVHLTAKEFDLLAFLARNPGRIFTRDQLLARVWGYDYAGDGRTIDVHVSWLRNKLRGPDGHDYFRTVRGVGYAFAPNPTG